MKKTKENKQTILDQLKRFPNIQVMCEKTGISRATFYRWKEKDKIFSQKIEDAIAESRAVVNDVAESALITAVKNGNMKGIMYWLRHNHKLYKNKVEIEGEVNVINEISPEKREEMWEALKLAGINFNQNEEEKSQEQKE